MRLVTMLVLVLLAGASYAGCVQKSSPGAAGTPCATAPCTAATPTPTGGGGTPTDPSTPIVNATLPTMRFENCSGLVFFVEVPPDWMRPVVPEAFAPVGNTPETNTLQFLALDCSRIVHRDQVIEDARLFFTQLIVDTVNRTWHHDLLSFYSLDFYVDRPGLSRALTDFGVPHENASISEVVTPLAGGGSRNEWAVKAAGGALFNFSFASTGGSPDGDKGLDNRWFGSTEFRRAESQSEARYTNLRGLEASAVTLSGTSKAATVLQGHPAAPVVVQVYDSWNEEWTMDESLYRR